MLFFTNTKGKVQIMIKSKKLHHESETQPLTSFFQQLQKG